jgi:hypothetical protein
MADDNDQARRMHRQGQRDAHGSKRPQAPHTALTARSGAKESARMAAENEAYKAGYRKGKRRKPKQS